VVTASQPWCVVDDVSVVANVEEVSVDVGCRAGEEDRDVEDDRVVDVAGFRGCSSVVDDSWEERLWGGVVVCRGHCLKWCRGECHLDRWGVHILLPWMVLCIRHSKWIFGAGDEEVDLTKLAGHADL
jgi:hypothetical protein